MSCDVRPVFASLGGYPEACGHANFLVKEFAAMEDPTAPSSNSSSRRVISTKRKILHTHDHGEATAVVVAVAVPFLSKVVSQCWTDFSMLDLW
jgi:hypothetical protein